MLSKATVTELYRLAFRYKKARLWKMLAAEQLFAVALPDGQIGYCTVLGLQGEQIALQMYVGQRGISSYYALQQEMRPGTDRGSLLLSAKSRNCLRCMYSNADDVKPEQEQEAKWFARQMRIHLTNPFRIPHFDTLSSGGRSVPIQEEADAKKLMVGLRAALFLCTGRSGAGRLYVVREPGDEIPLLTEAEPENFQVTRTVLPPREAPEVGYPGSIEGNRLMERE